MSMNSDSVVSAILTNLFSRYTVLDMSSCMFMHEFCEAIAKHLSIGRVLLGLITKSKEQKFIEELTEICKIPTTVYGYSYYSILRLLWLRFKETESLENNAKVLELFRKINYSMRFPLVQKVNYIVHNVAHMLHLHPQALPLTEVTTSVQHTQHIPISPITINNIYVNNTINNTPNSTTAIDKPILTSQTEQTTVPPVSECIVCMTNMNDTALISCGHIICNVCADHLHKSTKRCPICRNTFTTVLKIYI